MKNKKPSTLFCLIISIILGLNLVACGDNKPSNNSGDESSNNQTIPDPDSPTSSPSGTLRDSKPKVLKTDKTGSEVYNDADVSIDASGKNDGYVLVKYSGNAAKIRMLITTPQGNTYNYLISKYDEYLAYPLSEGDGTYNVAVYENVVDDQYATLYAADVVASGLIDEKVFLYPNAYVDFNDNTKAVAKGSEIVESATNDLDAVKLVYEYVTENIEYDYDKAETVQSGYAPVVDDTLSSGTGICFDYASLMATMLRTQGIPTKLEVGYCGDVYHAWISVWTEESGWIDDIIEFDGKDWNLMDPTLASYAKESTIKDYMDNQDSYYIIKYKY